MKAREFDNLIKTQYDQGDFAYNPKNWDRLAEQLDKKPNKSKMLLWLPMAAIVSFSSIAASLAMIISLPALVHHKAPAVAAMHKLAAPRAPHQYNIPAVPTQPTPPIAPANNYIAFVPKNTTTHKPEPNPFENLLLGSHSRQLLQNNINKDLHLAETILKGLPSEAPASKTNANPNLFAYNDHLDIPEAAERKGPKSTVSLLGGINHGTQSAGYTIGFTARTMISDKLYVEGDIAFVNNSNTGKAEYTTNTLTPTAKLAATTKQLSIAGGGADESGSVQTTVSKPTSFGMYYAQFTPSIGYNVQKRISVGVGADMQQLIQNTATATPDVTTDKVVPQFDMGLVGKTEYALSSRIKAGLYYRRGVTNMLVPYDKYLDRNYMQVQVKYSIFNK